MAGDDERQLAVRAHDHSQAYESAAYTDAEAVSAVEAAALTLTALLEAVQINKVSGGSGNIGDATTAAFQHGYFNGTLFADILTEFTAAAGITAEGVLLKDGGISFGTDLLSDYDVADFTPGLSFGGGTTGITYATQEARYVKVGPKVHVWGRFVLTSKGSSTGTALFTGLPFTCANTHLATGGQPINRSHTMASITPPLSTKVTPNATTVDLFQDDGAGNQSGAVTDANFADATGLYFEFSYYTNS
jgi:hypothetical protein